jgi:hypothetical protein
MLLGPFGNSRFFMRPSSPSLPQLVLFERDFQVSSYVKFTGTKRIPYEEIESAEITWSDLFHTGGKWITIHLQLRDRKNSFSIWMNEPNAKSVVDLLVRKSVPVTEKDRAHAAT